MFLSLVFHLHDTSVSQMVSLVSQHTYKFAKYPLLAVFLEKRYNISAVPFIGTGA